MDDSPLKTFEEIRQKMETSLVTLLGCTNNIPTNPFFVEGVTDNSIIFYALFIGANKLNIRRLFINSDNTITSTMSEYLLTPAT